MIQRWHKKKIQLPFTAFICFIFMLCTIFYYERHFHEINRNERDDVRHEIHDQNQDSIRKTFILKSTQLSRNSSLLKAPLVNLDRFSTCKSTIKYTKRKAGWDILSPESYKQEKLKDSCDVFSGKWVFDNTSYPLYNESNCPYMSDQLSCHKHGRPDLAYQYWRWQPHGCNLKRWNATELWEKLRGKRLMFVGDSVVF